jgi:hypothetical protein
MELNECVCNKVGQMLTRFLKKQEIGKEVMEWNLIFFFY